MKNKLTVALTGAILLSAITSCTKNGAPTPAPVQNNVRLASNATFGNILTDSAGKTLYFFSLDASGQSACTGGCVVYWPVFYKANPTLDTGLDSADFATITRTDGTLQTTYKGWPLYYYKPDSLPGDVKGDPVENLWFVAKPDYTVMLAAAQLVGADGNNYDSTYKVGTGVTNYITDAYGKTLYAYSPDKFNTNTYTAADFSNDKYWPCDTLSSLKNTPSIISKSVLATTNVFGKTQLTFKGWPLYYFIADANKRGNTKGVSAESPGFWPIVDQYSVTAPQ